jgi:hypothetical protein
MGKVVPGFFNNCLVGILLVGDFDPGLCFAKCYCRDMKVCVRDGMPWDDRSNRMAVRYQALRLAVR